MFAGISSKSVFSPHRFRPIRLLVDPYNLTPTERSELVNWLADKIKDLLSPQSIYANESFKVKILYRIAEAKRQDYLMPKRLVIGSGSWLNFDEVLSHPEFEDSGIYDCVAHYPLLIDAIKLTSTLTFCSFSSRVYIADLSHLRLCA